MRVHAAWSTHAWKNSGNEAARALFMYIPGKAGILFEDAQQMPTSPARKTDAELAEIYRHNGWEIVGPPPFDE